MRSLLFLPSWFHVCTGWSQEIPITVHSCFGTHFLLYVKNQSLHSIFFHIKFSFLSYKQSRINLQSFSRCRQNSICYRQLIFCFHPVLVLSMFIFTPTLPNLPFTSLTTLSINRLNTQGNVIYPCRTPTCSYSEAFTYFSFLFNTSTAIFTQGCHFFFI